VNRIVHADNLEVLRATDTDTVDLIYGDPPFNTGQPQRLTAIRTDRDEEGDRIGFGGRRYRTTRLTTASYPDQFDDYLGFLEPRLVEFRRVLAWTGTLYLHLDQRESHYVKVLLDRIFGRECFLNEVIWAYDYGGRSIRRWPAKHDTILVYVKDPRRYYFDTSAVDRIAYLAPGLVGSQKAARGKLPTDTWWHTIVPPGGRERTGYPTQKPLGVLRRILAASSPPGGLVADFFAGSGTTGVAAHELGRRFLLVDDNPQAIAVMRKRFSDADDVRFEKAG
jgi:site-specific DNA-methyltransferase (adenine-specific)